MRIGGDLAYPVRSRLTAGENGAEAGLAQNFGDLGAFISLDLDLAILNRAASAAGLLHLFGQLLFFRQTNAHEVLNHRHGLAATPRLLPDDINPTSMLPRRLGWGHGMRR